MKKMLVVILFSTTLLAACVPVPPTVLPGLANPASRYCATQGGRVQIRDAASGQVGYCVFSDGSECEEWALYRGQCSQGGRTPGIGMPNPASKHCAEKGGRSEILNEAGGQVGYCIFANGSECEEWAFFRGDCAPNNK